MTSLAASVVIPSRGGAGRLPGLLKALAAQTVSDFEVIVVLDGDVDGSEAVVSAAAASGLPVRAVVFPENRGRSAALNAGFAEACGHVLIRCDDDLLPAPGYVAGHVARHSDAEASGAGPIGVIGHYRSVFKPSAYARSYGRKWDTRARLAAYAMGGADLWQMWSANASVTRDVFDRVGEYDTAFREYGWEDVDWGFRLTRLGVQLYWRQSWRLWTLESRPQLGCELRRLSIRGRHALGLL